MTSATLAHLFTRSAEKWPDNPALYCHGQKMSYRDLYSRASLLAHAIRSLIGEEPQNFIGVWSSRRPADYIGVIGTALSGHAYVPVNSTFPAQRNAFILDKAGASVLFCDHADLEDVLSVTRRLRRPFDVIVLDAGPETPALVANTALHRLDQHAQHAVSVGPPPALQGGAAYLLFTSGSTGDPKGVVVRQSNVVAYLETVHRLFSFQQTDRFTQLFELSFDLSVHDMFACWQAGACLYVFSRAETLLPHRTVNKHRLTVWFSVPTQAALLLRNGLLTKNAMPTLQISLFCGEALPDKLAAAWSDAAPSSRIHNLYGPTEATIAISSYEYKPGGDHDVVPIGRVFPGNQYRVLTDDGGEALPGEAGELVLGGIQVTEGYLNDPVRTKESFFSPAPNQDAGQDLWYRTGDRVLASPSGCLHFIGRCNRQVKIHGYRVELGEIEATIQRLINGASVAVLFNPEDSAGEGLVAFLNVASLNAHTLRERCRETLPEYMVPMEFNAIETMPVTPSGKLDYKTLYRWRFGEQPQRTGDHHAT